MATPRKSAKSKSQADARAVRDFRVGLRKLPDAYLECRDMMHSYVVTHDFHVVPGVTEGGKVTFVDRVFGCLRCPRTRTQHFKQGRYGLEKLGETVYSPVDYRLPGIPRGVSARSIVQQEAYRRAMEKATGSKKGQRATAER